MKLYQGDGPNSYRVRIFMAEKGIEVPMVRIDFAKREHRSPQFLKLNSLGQIPVLELDDGTVLTQNAATLGYLADTHPEAKLYGDGTEGPRRSPSLAGPGQFRPASRLQAAVRRDRLSR